MNHQLHNIRYNLQLIHLEISTMSCYKPCVERNAVSLCAMYTAAPSPRVSAVERRGARRLRIHPRRITYSVPTCAFPLFTRSLCPRKSIAYVRITARLCNAVETVTLLSYKSSNVPVKCSPASNDLPRLRFDEYY